MYVPRIKQGVPTFRVSSKRRFFGGRVGVGGCATAVGITAACGGAGLGTSLLGRKLRFGL